MTSREDRECLNPDAYEKRLQPLQRGKPLHERYTLEELSAAVEILKLRQEWKNRKELLEEQRAEMLHRLREIEAEIQKVEDQLDST